MRKRPVAYGTASVMRHSLTPVLLLSDMIRGLEGS